MNGTVFLAYLKQILVPTLSPGDIIIMDNLPAHKASGVRQAIEQVGTELKVLLRAKVERAIRGLWEVVGDLIDTFKVDCEERISG